MKKLLFILTLVLAALLPVELWAQGTTGGDDGSDAVAAPTFRFDGDYLVIETVTEDASIFYQMANLPDMSDETIEKIISSMTVTPDVSQSMYYEQPILLQKSVVLKAIAAGATNSEVSTLVYDYDAWNGLSEAIEYGWHVQELAKDNANVDADLKEELQWALDESKHIFDERATIPYQEAQHFANQIYDICDKIEEQMSGQATAEPYSVLSENNTVLTFYYDDQKAARNGMGVGPFSNSAYQSWYDQRESITSVVFDALFANCTTISSTAYWFFECKNLSTITDVKNLKTDNVTDMRWMFYGCSGLTSLDLSHFETSNVTDMGLMFYGCSGLTNLDLSHFNTSNVTDMSVMFSYCSSLTSLDVSHFETSNVTDIGMMFYGCSALVNIFGNNWDLSKLESGSMVFGNCTSLVGGAGTVYNANHTDYTYAHIDEGPSNPGYFTDKNAPVIAETEPYAVLSENNTVLTFYYDDQKAARGGMAINNGYLGDSPSPYGTAASAVFDVSFANYYPTSTAYWFDKCSSLASISGMENLKTDNVTSMSFMFEGCSSLTGLDVSGFKTGNVTDMVLMFEGCSSLAFIQAGSANISAYEYARIGNPNLLVYVDSEQYAPAGIQNVVVGDVAKNIVLTDVTEGNGNFYCPQEFKAESITYSHDYGQTTEIGVARGWESIALPFAVQTITHETKGLIAPFGNDASNKHFWLRQLTENGLARATEIEPNTAYLISMPNNNAYYADFNLNGLVTFSSVDVWMPKTQIHAVDYHTEKGMVVLLPNFQRRASDYTTYALNVGEQRGDYPEGSVFEREYRDIRPFEAYTFHQGGAAPRFLPISDLNGDDATGIEEVRSLMAEGRGDVWYDMSGRRLQQKPAGKGVYILNGRKVVIK